MNVFMEFFLFFMSILQFLFPFAFKDTEVPEQTTDTVIEETVAPEEHEHTGGNYNCLQSAICEICGELYGSRGDHIYTATVTPATCDEGGYTTYRCRFCLDTKVEDYTEPTGHDYESSVTKVTCTSAAYERFVCKNCGDAYSNEIEPAKGHSFKEKYFSANCTQGYRVEYKCETCKYTYSEEYNNSLGHEYNGEITLPTCQVGGYTTYTCIRCPDSYIADRTPTVSHKYTNYVPNNDATCTSNGTKTAYCDYSCGTPNTIAGDGPMLPHADNNKDTVCDAEGCTAKVYMNFSYLQYPEEALANVNLATFLSKADADYANGEIYAANKGLTHNSVIKSPYFTARITGRVDGNTAVTTQNIPVYGTIVHIGETGKGALHSFSEIYVAEGEYDAFAIEINSGTLNIQNAVILSPDANERVTVANGKATAILSGYGTHAIIFNGENQQYVYTVHVRELIDEDAEIAELKEKYGEDRVYVAGSIDKGDDFGSFVTSIACAPYVGEENMVIYLRRGTYFVADHVHDIDNSDDESGNSEEADTGIGQNRWAFITANRCKNIKILGYGAFDLGQLDRSERRGMIFADSENIEVRGVKLFNSPQWSFITYKVNNMTIKDVDIYGYRQNSDAFDICNSKNVTVEGCFTRTGDDGFVVKTLGGDENATSDNVLIRDCDAWVGKARAFGIFGETEKNISNVTFRDNRVLFHDAVWDYLRIPAIGIVVEGDDTNPGLAVNNSGKTLTNITFENIEICRNRSSAMNCIIFNRVENYKITGLTFKNISFEKMNQVEYDDEMRNSVSTIDSFNATSTIERNVILENIFCGNTKVTDQNYTNYFNPEATHYCGSFK